MLLRCSRCGADKPPDAFTVDPECGRGYRYRCKACEAELRRARRAQKRAAANGAADFDIDETPPEPAQRVRPDPPLPPPPEAPKEAVLPAGAALERVLFVPDTHRPYHDKRAWQLLLQAGRALKPDVVVVLGDFADFYSVSAHDKDPNRTRRLEDEVADVVQGLQELTALGARRKVFVAGNHEDRLERYLAVRAPELFNMVRVRDLFQLDAMGWQFVPYKRHLRLGKLHITHDTGRAGRYAHYQSMADFGGANALIGHTHRLGYAVEGSAQGEAHVTAMFGWLGDFEAVDYMHQVRARRDWALGFGAGLMEPNGHVHLTPVPLVGNSCVVAGQLVTLDWRG